jgi:hypothetical protein
MHKGWLERLQTLLARHSYIGLNADIASFSLIELYGVYCYLSRLTSN